MARRIYSKGGKIGVTSLLSGQRVAKSCHRVDAYGVVDELQAHIGLLIATCTDAGIIPALRTVQAELLIASAELAMGPGANLNGLADRISQDHVTRLELEIDHYAAIFPLPKRFILPGGSVDSAHAHLARTVCRRAERRVTSLGDTSGLAMVMQYLNRLGDLLFTIAWGLEIQAIVKEALGLDPEPYGLSYEYTS